MADSGEHPHQFKLTAHFDGCHWFTTTAHCACGAKLVQHGERDVSFDPYQAEFFSADCARCSELRDGAKPIYRITTEAAA